MITMRTRLQRLFNIIHENIQLLSVICDPPVTIACYYMRSVSVCRTETPVILFQKRPLKEMHSVRVLAETLTSS